jgi:hypothetical protein
MRSRSPGFRPIPLDPNPVNTFPDPQPRLATDADESRFGPLDRASAKFRTPSLRDDERTHRCDEHNAIGASSGRPLFGACSNFAKPIAGLSGAPHRRLHATLALVIGGTPRCSRPSTPPLPAHPAQERRRTVQRPCHLARRIRIVAIRSTRSTRERHERSHDAHAAFTTADRASASPPTRPSSARRGERGDVALATEGPVPGDFHRR